MRKVQKCTHLELWEEVVGIIRDVDFNSGIINFSRFNVFLSIEFLQTILEISRLKGKKIAILRTDHFKHPIRIRCELEETYSSQILGVVWYKLKQYVKTWRNIVVLKFRKFYKFSMMKPALAGNIIHNLKRLRKIYALSYFLGILSIFFLRTYVSSYFFMNTFVVNTNSSHKSLHYSIGFGLLFLGLISSDDGHIEPEPSKIGVIGADRIEERGGIGKRIAYYIRVSTKKQVKYGDSIGHQKDTINKMIQSLNPSKVYGYIDPGKSGREFNNRKITIILKLAQSKLIDEFWVTQIDRVGRTLLDLLYFLLSGLTVRILGFLVPVFPFLVLPFHMFTNML